MAEKSSRRRTVWIVDDSPLDAEHARRTLATTYNVEVFGDGTSVLEHLNSHAPPDVLVLDWIMPGISGVDVCRFLRGSHSAWSNVAILLLTAQQDTGQVVEGLLAGANDYLSKPYAPEELQARVLARIRTVQLLERAERAEANVRILLDRSPDPLLFLDAENTVGYANVEATRALSRPAEALVGLPVAELLPTLSPDQLVENEDPSKPLLPDVKLDERIYSPSIRQLAIDDSHGTMVTLHDVTERRRADSRRLDFYSIMAHDLRGPLTAMMLRTSTLLRGRRGVLSAEALNEVHRIESGARSLLAMINDFLDLARLEGTGYKIDREEVDLGSLIQGTVDELRPLVEASRISLNLDFAPQGARIAGDQRRLVQVVSNLVGNAIKFTQPGGTIRLQMAPAGEFIETSVIDTGSGIPKEALPTLFNRFTRAVRKDHAIGGTGLGLMIVREIVEAHGGVVGVESEEGVGSRFWFRLPKAA